jgi:hypothetical protein
MVHLVLEDAGEILVGIDRHVVALQVVSGEMDLLRPDDVPMQARDREAPFFELPFATGR